MSASVPSLSVVIPTRNYGHYLGTCLDALLTQSVAPDEIIVVDDASSDDTAGVVRAAQQRDGRVHLLRLDEQRGLFGALERGVEQARGEYLYLHSADDLVLPGFVEQSLTLLAAHPDAGLCCCDPVYLDEGTEQQRPQPLGWSSSPRFFSPAAFADVIQGRAIAGHTVVVQRSAWNQIGGERPALKWHADWFAWLAIGFARGLCYIPRGLAVARVHTTSYSGTSRHDDRARADVIRALLALLGTREMSGLVPYFVRGDILAHHGAELVRCLLADGTCDQITLALARRPIRRWAIRVTAHEPEPLRTRGRNLASAACLASAAFDIGEGRWWAALGDVARESRERPEDLALSLGVAAIALALGKPHTAVRWLGDAAATGTPPENPRFALADALKAVANPDTRVGLSALLKRIDETVPTLAPVNGRRSYDHVKRVAIFGAGEYGALACDLAARCGWQVAYFVDHAADRFSHGVCGRRVIAPSALVRSDVDLLIIATLARRDEMFAQAAALGFLPGEDVVWLLEPVLVGGLRIAIEAPCGVPER